MREHQSVIGQSVGHHIILAVDVVHRPMNPALTKGVTEGDAGSKVRPQVGRSASSLPAAKDDNLARDNLGVQFEDDPLINVCHAKRPLHAALETNVFSHVVKIAVVFLFFFQKFANFARIFLNFRQI